MQKSYTCKYCNKEYKINQSRNGHQVHCPLNPKSKELQKKIIQTRKNNCKPIKTKKVWVNKICTKCDQEYSVLITPYANQKGLYAKHCSRSCANSRIHSIETKQKISKSLEYSYSNIEYRNCIICNKLMVFKVGKSRKTCSLSCLRKSQHNAWELGVIGGSGWRSRKLISYPQKFFMGVLKNKGIQYAHNYKVLKCDLVQSSKGYYFLDFYLPKYNTDLQIDGSQHKALAHKQHDEIRDNLLSNRYTVYRIQWNDINTDNGKIIMKQKIDKFIQTLQSLYTCDKIE